MIKIPQPYNVLGLGDACVDLIIPISEKGLEQVPGEKGGSQLIGIDELQRILSTSESVPVMTTGGSSANTIKGLAGLGEKCAFLSYRGNDSQGEYFSLNLKQWGIQALLTQSDLPTPIVACLITPDKQRTMRFFAGCSEKMTDDFLHLDDFKGIRLLHLEAYSFRRGCLIERAVELAKETDALISMDLSSFEIVREFKERILRLIPTIDIVFANEHETRELTGLEPFEGCLKMQELDSIAVVLRGKEGCLVGQKGQVFSSAGYPTEIVDSTGAGDLFASGFLHGILQGFSLDKCAKLGNRLGSAIVEVTGAELPREKWKVVKEFINVCLS